MHTHNRKNFIKESSITQHTRKWNLDYIPRYLMMPSIFNSSFHRRMFGFTYFCTDKCSIFQIDYSRMILLMENLMDRIYILGTGTSTFMLYMCTGWRQLYQKKILKSCYCYTVDQELRLCMDEKITCEICGTNYCIIWYNSLT